ncbi:glycosyltransferase [Roseateles sp. DB2]|uniref:glycosyltransferase n=1 Tax=Roseateles sp. DB2 TaxID=3453717 RepID=UPI003EE9F83E
MKAAGGRLLLYAPNVHTGGGLVLLKSLLAAWPADRPLRAWLDARAREALALPASAQVSWVMPAPVSRLKAQWSAVREGRPEDRLLCFHGLPLLWPTAACVEVFLQNRNYLGEVDLGSYRLRTRLRLHLEQGLFRRGRGRVHRYWVQTPSMAAALTRWWGGGGAGMPPVQVLPFLPPMPACTAPAAHDAQAPELDFLYVADGEAHKNHRRLIEAWCLLAAQGWRPSLGLTLGAKDQALRDWVDQQAQANGLRIRQLGVLQHEELLSWYRRCRALVFPSLSESFGLPLMEARQAGCPVLASELDYVRDVCVPVQTFDPLSAVSMARAVCRFDGRLQSPLEPAGAEAFLAALMTEPQ